MRIFALAIALTALAAAQNPTVTGTARISGTVVADDTQKTPLGGAIVTVSGAGLTRSRSTITTVDGSFGFTSLPAGRFVVTASKPAYLTMAFGARRPDRQGTALTTTAGQDVRDVVIRLPRGAVIKGILRDQNGEPVAGILVNAAKPGTTRASASTIPSAVTDDRGAYRIFGLTPGDYFVTATFRVTGNGSIGVPASSEIDRALADLQRNGSPTAARPVAPTLSSVPPPVYAYAPTFFPGTSNSAAAERVTLASGDERTADFVVAPVRAGSVEGVLQTADGSPLPSVLPSLVSDGPAVPVTIGAEPFATTRPRSADGRFKFTGVTPGSYVLTMRTIAMETGGARGGPAGSAALWAMAAVTTDGNDVTGLSLTLRPALHFSGKVVFDGAGPAPADPSIVRINLVAPRGIGVSYFNSSLPPTIAGVVRPDGTFDMASIMPGSYGVATTPPLGWWLRSAVVNGADVLDGVLDVGTTDITGAVLTFTDRHTEISGSLQTASSAPAPDYFVVVFSSDRTHWRPGARRVQSMRPATDGQFAVRDLPAGDYYIAALTDVAPEDLGDATFLAGLVSSAVKVTLAEGEKKTQDLRIGR